VRKFLYADEAGDFEFARKPNVSRYFILCSVTMGGCNLGHQLLDLRRDLAWRGNTALGDYFHASEDNQCIRNEVFRLIQAADIRIDATIVEKSKVRPKARSSHASFYRYVWYYHFKFAAPAILRCDDELLLTAASLGRRRERGAFTDCVNQVVQRVATENSWATYFCPAATEPCLQLADYCTWAIQRKWERKDLRSYHLIADKVVREYDLLSASSEHYY
jgi:hypothetical protein